MNNHQKQIDDWFKNKAWEYWDPMVINARLMEEVGELARLINHLYGSMKKKPDEAKQDLELEIGDILYTLACFANSHDIDLDDAFHKSIDKVTNRDKDRFN
jgi:NTP pyrophosphatase (non-canonical NTP hydrolase)